MVKNIIYLPDGTEVSSGSKYAIKSSSFVRCVNSGDELTIGSTCANKAEFVIFDPGAKLSVKAGQEITVYREEGTTRKKVGVYVLEKPSRPSVNTLKLVGYDRIVKLEKDMTEWLDSLDNWPYMPLDFAAMVCAECGLDFVTTEAPNQNFPLYKFKRQGVTARKLMQWVAEICCRFCRADADGDIEFAWYTPANVTIRATGDRYYFGNNLTYKTYTVAPVDAVQIRLADSVSGALWPQLTAENPYIITDNAILNHITEWIDPYLDVITEELQGAVYTPCDIGIPACLDVDVGNIVTVEDRNGVTFTAYVMEKQTVSQKDIIRCKGSAKRPVQAGNYDEAYQAVEKLDKELDSVGVFNRLTDNGAKQGIYMEGGQLYVNGAFIKADTLLADKVRLTPADKEWIYFGTLQELNEYVEEEIFKLQPNTQRVLGVTLDLTESGEYLGGYGILTMSFGYDPDRFIQAFVTLDIGGRRLFRIGSSDSDNVEDFTWNTIDGYDAGYNWSEVGVPLIRRMANAKNLLDNSDFTNPVNQRGGTNYSGKRQYTIDRWTTLSSNASITIYDNGVLAGTTTTSDGMLYQILKLKPNKVYTLAVWTNSVRPKIITFTFVEASSWSTVASNSFGSDLSVSVMTDASKMAFVGLSSRKQTYTRISHVALYEGEYTDANIPQYQPKGYSAELAECQRYYQIRSTNDVPFVDLRPTMQSDDISIYAVSNGYAYSADL